MSTQPKALILAIKLELHGTVVMNEAAAELRRMHAVNADLLEALKTIMAGVAGCQREPQWEAARAAIAKATEAA